MAFVTKSKHLYKVKTNHMARLKNRMSDVVCRRCKKQIFVGDTVVTKGTAKRVRYNIYHEDCARWLKII